MVWRSDIGTHDSSLRLNSLRLWNDTDGCSSATGETFCMSLTANASATLAPGDVWSRTIVLSLVQDGQGSTAYSHWAAAASLYREWFESIFPQPNYPTWAKGGRPMTGIDASADEHFYGEREVEIDDPWFFGASHLIVWGTAAVPQCCPGFPIPDPARGGGAGLKAYAERLHSSGMTMSTYFESQQVNPLYSNSTSFRGCKTADLPEEMRPPPLSVIEVNARRELPGAEVSLPNDFDALVEIMNKQDGSYADVEQYFALQANKTSRDLHLLFPVHHDEAGWFSSYLSQWMANVGALGVDAPYLDQLGAMPEAPNFGAQWGDGGGGARVYDLVKQGGAAAEAYSRQNDSWGFSYELYTDVWSQAGGISLLSGHRIIPCSAMCSPSVPHRCTLCDESWPWLDRQFGDPLSIWNESKGLTANWEVIRTTFPHHAVFEGLNNIPAIAPLVLRVVGLGFIEGHVPDLYSAGGGNAFGMLAPIAWMRQAISPWIDDRWSDYRYTEGVLRVSGDETEVRQHRSQRGRWAMFTVFSPIGTAKQLSLSVAESLACSADSDANMSSGSSCSWFLLSASGNASPIQSCSGHNTCDVEILEDDAKSYASAVLVVAGKTTDGAERPQALTLARVLLAVPSVPRLLVTICNTEPRPITGAVAISALELAVANTTVQYSLAPHSCDLVEKHFNLSGSDLPLHLQLSGDGSAGIVDGGLRRLAPVPIADPHFMHRRFADGVVERPADLPAIPNSTGSGGPFVMALQGDLQGASARTAGC